MDDDFPYELTVHARDAVRERDIPLHWIERTIESPEQVELDRRFPDVRHALRRIPEYGNRVLRVVYVSTENPYRIVTIFFDRRVKELT